LPWNLDRWNGVTQTIQRHVTQNNLPAVSLEIGDRNGPAQSFHAGRDRLTEGGKPVSEDSLFLTASLTKPIVALALLQFVEQGQIGLTDRVTKFIPEFAGAGRHAVEIRHLLTHTSGLPDMLPDNQELRMAHASHDVFLQKVCEQSLAFPPGRAVQYQSMGFVLIAEIVQRLSGQTYSQYLDETIFRPLGMARTCLGLPPSWNHGNPSPADAIVEVAVPLPQQGGADWNWNSAYWRQLGAPWGGLLSTAADLGKLCRCLLTHGDAPHKTALWSPALLAAATRNQLNGLRDLPEEDRRCKPWGWGWRLNWPDSATFGDLLSPQAYGHWGATGTLLWIDPDREIYAVILTNRPWEDSMSQIVGLSNQLAALWTPE